MIGKELLLNSLLISSSKVELHASQGQARALCIALMDDAAPAGEALSTELRHLGEVHAGIATITLPIVDAFVPKMLNYESVARVNFKKGCYPGQKVVSRSQFRGNLKRRAYVAQIDASELDKNLHPLFHTRFFKNQTLSNPAA